MNALKQNENYQLREALTNAVWLLEALRRDVDLRRGDRAFDIEVDVAIYQAKKVLHNNY